MRLIKILIISFLLIPSIIWGATTISQGGTNITSYTTGDIIYAISQYVLGKLGIGANGQFLTITGGVPTWGDAMDLTSNQTIAGVKTFSSNIQTSAGDCTEDNEYCQKSFIEEKAIQPSRTAVRALTTTALPTALYSNGDNGIGASLSGTSNGALPAQDGVTLVLGDRLLVKDQANVFENGIYEVMGEGDVDHYWELSRVTDFDEVSGSEVANGAYTYSTEGATASTFWRLAVTSAITIGTTNLPFYQLNAASVYEAGDGLDLSGTLFGLDLKANDGLAIKSTELGVDYDDSSIGITSNKLAVKPLGITNAMLAGGIDLTTKTTGYTNGQLLIGNSASGLSKNTIQAGSNITVTNGDGTISISAAGGSATYTGDGVSSTTALITVGNDAQLLAERAIQGTANQVTVTDGGANNFLTLSLPQNIDTGATVNFANLILSGSATTTGNATTTGKQYVGSDLTVGGNYYGTWAGGIIPVSLGGTGSSTITTGMIPYGSATGVYSGLAGPTTANHVLKSSGANAFSWGALVDADIPGSLTFDNTTTTNAVITNSTTTGNANFNTVTGISLDEIENPASSKAFSMGGNTVTWNFTNPVGGMLFNMTGGWSGHALEIMDSSAVPNGSVGDHLLHIESDRSNVIAGHFVNTSTGATALKVDGLAQFMNGATTTALTVSGNSYFPSGIWNSSGNVGIGTTGPASALHIQGVSDAILFAVDTAGFLSTLSTNAGGFRTDASNNVNIDLPTGSTFNYNTRDITGATRDLIFKTGAGTVSVLTLHGGSDQSNEGYAEFSNNVGIGTSTPDSKLQIEGTGNMIKLTNSSGAFDQLTVSNAGSGDTTILGPLNNDLIFKSQGNGGTEGFQFQDSGGNDILVVDAINDRVGIGTASPGTPLHIVANTSNNNIRLEENSGGEYNDLSTQADGSLRFISDTSNSRYIEIPDGMGGFTGVFDGGASSPINFTSYGDTVGFRPTITLAHNGGSLATVSTTTLGSTLGDINFRGYNQASVVGASIAAITSAEWATCGATCDASDQPTDLVFSLAADSSTSQEKFRMTNGGRFGIATSSPNAALHIVNTASVNSLLVEDSASVDATPFVIDSAGNVGIGKTNPATMLDIAGIASSTGLQVNGNATITGNLTVSGNISATGLVNKTLYATTASSSSPTCRDINNTVDYCGSYSFVAAEGNGDYVVIVDTDVTGPSNEFGVQISSAANSTTKLAGTVSVDNAFASCQNHSAAGSVYYCQVRGMGALTAGVTYYVNIWVLASGGESGITSITIKSN